MRSIWRCVLPPSTSQPVFAMDPSSVADSAYELFIEFKYPEIRDLLKQFLTLISATLVFSVTFSERIVDYRRSSSALQRNMVFTSWFMLVTALGACGIGLYLNYLTAEAAFVAMSSGVSEQFRKLESLSYLFQDLGGILFGGGLMILVLAAIVKAPPSAEEAQTAEAVGLQD